MWLIRVIVLLYKYRYLKLFFCLKIGVYFLINNNKNCENLKKMFLVFGLLFYCICCFVLVN